MRHFFVSYTHKDFAKALDIARVLKDSSGADYWIDESGIKSWYRFIEVIVRALDDSFALVVIMSRSVLQSKYVKLEIGYALKKGIQVIPVSVDGQPVHSSVRPFSDLRECVGIEEAGAILRTLSASSDEHDVPFDVPDTAVDLGLSVRWARMNIGAAAPSLAGALFTWDRFTSNDPKVLASFPNEGEKKYSFSDGKTELASEDDIAAREWGGHWRMPRRDEFQELIDRCVWTWEEGRGYHITSKVNGASVFLPVTTASEGLYWSNEAVFSHDGFFFDFPDDSKAFSLFFTDRIQRIRPEYRDRESLAVRPVWDMQGMERRSPDTARPGIDPLCPGDLRMAVLFRWDDYSQGVQFLYRVEEETGIRPRECVGIRDHPFGSNDEAEAVDESNLVFILLSEAAMKTDWVKTALRYVSHKDIRLIAIRLDFCELSEWAQFELGVTTVVDYYSDSQMTDLLSILRTAAGK